MGIDEIDLILVSTVFKKMVLLWKTNAFFSDAVLMRIQENDLSISGYAIQQIIELFYAESVIHAPI